MNGVPAFDEMLLILTAQCNSRCRYCYQSAKFDRAMDPATLDAAISLAVRSAASPLTLVFLGGEPLLQCGSIRCAVELVSGRAPAGLQIGYRISTNGFLLDDETASFLAKHRFDVQLSFDGVEKAQDLRAPGTFPVIDRTLDRLREDHPALFEQMLRVCITLVPDAIPHLFESVRYLAAKGVRRIGISPSLLHHPEWSNAWLAELERQFAGIFDHSLELFRRAGETPVLCFRKQSGEEESQPETDAMCALAGGRRLALDVDGQVYGCAILAESYQDLSGGLLGTAVAPLRLGHLNDAGLIERLAAFPAAVSRSELFHHRMKKHSSYGNCAGCEYARSCSVCPVSIGNDPANADPHRVPDFVCAFNRTALKYRDRFPAMPHPLGRFGELLDQARRERLATG